MTGTTSRRVICEVTNGGRARKSLFGSGAILGVSLLIPSEALADVVVQVDEMHQVMDGFGASSAFFSKDISQEDADFLFSEDDGIGLSLLRVRIHHERDEDGKVITEEIETAKKAYALGASVWAAPWTPPPMWKTNFTNSGEWDDGLSAQPMAHLKSEHFPDFADYLADFVEYMEEEGIGLLALTPQNEPDWEASWDGCLWTPEEMVTFIGQHLGPEFESRGLSTMIVAPDTAHLKNLDGFAQALVADTEAMKYLDGISTHPYNEEGFPDSWTVPADNDLLFWQTEISQENFDPRDYPDPSMNSALSMVKMMHQHITELGMSAWNWWNLTAVTEDYEEDINRQNPALIQNGEKFRRAYVMGNFSKFVRPGFTRLGATAQPAAGVMVSAFRGEGRLVIVAINENAAASSQSFSLQGGLGGTVDQAIPWVTSDNVALEAQAALAVDATDLSFAFSLPEKSVTSFVLAVEESVTTGSGGASGAGGSTGTGAAPGTGGGPGNDGLGSGGLSGAGASGAGVGGTLGAGASLGSGAASGTGASLGMGASVGTGVDSGAGVHGPGSADGEALAGDLEGCACRIRGAGTQGRGIAWVFPSLLMGLLLVRKRRRPSEQKHLANYSRLQ